MKINVDNLAMLKMAQGEYGEINRSWDSAEASMATALSGDEWVSANYFAEMAQRAGAIKYGDYGLVFGGIEWRFEL